MVCKNKVSTAKTTEDKDSGARVMTYTTTRKCSSNPAAIEEEEDIQVAPARTEEEETDLMLVKPEEERETTLEEIKFIFERFMRKS